MEKSNNKFTILSIIFVILVIYGTYSIWNNFFADVHATSQTSEPSVNNEIVANSSYDGSVRQVEDWLQKNFNDPKSIERIEWSPVSKTEQGNYVVRYKFRAKNESGGIQVYNKAFILGTTGIVIAATDYES
jgi:hypothetical protein